MADITVSTLLDRLSRVDPAGDAEVSIRSTLQAFRRERECGGPISEAQWRGLMLSARDLMQRPQQHGFRKAAIERALESEITGRTAILPMT